MGPLLFFAISGFLLYRPWVAARAHGRPLPHTARYARRRALRILPAYWFALTVLAIFPGITGAFTGDWWRYYFFLQLYDADTLARGHPDRVDAVRRGDVLSRAAAVGLAVQRVRLGGGQRAWLRAELAALAVLAAFGAAVQVAAGRQALDGLGRTEPARAVHVVRARHGARGRQRRRGRRGEPRRTRLQAVAARPGLCWAGAVATFAALVVLRAQPDGFFGIAAAAADRAALPEARSRTSR